MSSELVSLLGSLVVVKFVTSILRESSRMVGDAIQSKSVLGEIGVLKISCKKWVAR